MSITDKPFARRDFLRGSLAAAALIPAGGSLAACATVRHRPQPGRGSVVVGPGRTSATPTRSAWRPTRPWTP